MMELIQFIFSSFWVFLGMLVLIYVILEGIADIIKAFHKPSNRDININCNKHDNDDNYIDV